MGLRKLFIGKDFIQYIMKSQFFKPTTAKIVILILLLFVGLFLKIVPILQHYSPQAEIKVEGVEPTPYAPLKTINSIYYVISDPYFPVEFYSLTYVVIFSYIVISYILSGTIPLIYNKIKSKK